MWISSCPSVRQNPALFHSIIHFFQHIVDSPFPPSCHGRLLGQLLWWSYQDAPPGWKGIEGSMNTRDILMTSSNGNVIRVTGPLCGEFTGHVFFHLRMNKRLSKQSWGWWFETPSWSFWCHCNGWGQWPTFYSEWVNCWNLRQHFVDNIFRNCFISWFEFHRSKFLWVELITSHVLAT